MDTIERKQYITDRIHEVKRCLNRQAVEQRSRKAVLRQSHDLTTPSVQSNAYHTATHISAALNVYAELRGKVPRHGLQPSGTFPSAIEFRMNDLLESLATKYPELTESES